MNTELLQSVGRSGIITPEFVRQVIASLQIDGEHKTALVNCIPMMFRRFSAGDFSHVDALTTLRYSDMWPAFCDTETALSPEERSQVFEALKEGIAAALVGFAEDVRAMSVSQEQEEEAG